MSDKIEKNLERCRDGRDVSFFDLCSIDDATDADLQLIFELARVFRETKTAKLSFCRNISMTNAFFENSTRTQASFDLAGKHLDMDINNVGTTSSVKKGESFLDTLETIDAYNVKIIVIRCSESGIPEIMKKYVKASVISAGDGWHEHPTQGLLDALTMLDHAGKNNLSGKIVTIVGDIRHSRVFGSLIRILKRLKAKVRVAAPDPFIPAEVEKFGLELFNNAEEALTGADVAYALRVQEERGAKGFIPNLGEYARHFCITPDRLKLAKKDAILMHPGPVIRNVDVHTSLVARHPQSRILAQVENGLAVRKALLWLLAQRMDGKEKKYELM